MSKSYAQCIQEAVRLKDTAYWMKLSSELTSRTVILWYQQWPNICDMMASFNALLHLSGTTNGDVDSKSDDEIDEIGERIKAD